MKIAFAVSITKWGGVKTWCLDNGVALKKGGHGIFIYGRPGAFPAKARALGLNSKDCYFGMDFNPMTILFFIREFKKQKIDICICNVAKDMRTAGIAAKLLGIPILRHLGDVGDLKNSFKIRLIQRLLSPILVTCSEFCYKQLIKRFSFLQSYSFKAIHPGVVPSESSPVSVNSEKVIITTCQLNKNKGHIDMLKALSILRKDGFKFRCIIVGKGHYEKEIKQFCEDFGLSDITQFTGHVSNVQEQLSKGDIFILPSYQEALGIALEEAMANGLACIARNNGGVPEIWPPGLDALLVDYKDTGEEMALVLKRLLTTSDNELLAMKKCFYMHAIKTFHAETQAKKLEMFIKEEIEE